MSRNGCAPVRWISPSCPPPAGRRFSLTELFREPLLCIVPGTGRSRRDDPGADERPELCGAMRRQTPKCASSSRNTRSAPSAAATSSTTSPTSPWWRPGLLSPSCRKMLLRDCKAAVKVYPIEPEEYRVVGLAVAAPGLHGSRRGADVPPHRGVLLNWIFQL